MAIILVTDFNRHWNQMIIFL